jgi:hypothetical protein
MVDPVQLVLAPLAARAVNRAIQSAFGSHPDSSVPQLALSETIALPDDESEEILGVFTREQIDDIDLFLDCPEVAALFHSWCMMRLLNDDPVDKAEILDRMREAFADLARQWYEQRSTNWISFTDEIWRLSTNSLQEATVGLTNLKLATVDEDQAPRRPTTGALLLRGKRQPTPLPVRRIVELLNNPARTLEARSAVNDIRMASKRYFSELQLNHVQEDYRFEADKLYVSRTLTLRTTETKSPADTVLSVSRGRSRVVVMGDPGVGKSTLVRHTMHKIASQDGIELAPLLVECREYAGSSWGNRLSEFIESDLATRQSIDVKEATLVDVLSLGSAYVILDGLDEIIDLTRRREFVRQIESFSRSYPLVPILVTSRRVGYTKASFNDNIFETYELSEFTYPQFLEYTDKWFSATNRSSPERDSFVRESEAVDDIRLNPLMLSLLCTLYRARGHIPRNRRQVYRECAELLFQRWDSMRHVEQPYDHRQYGERLMQELARFFFKSQSAQAGVEEGQLERVIAMFFQDTASVEPPENLTRARQFLDFCADRAWLLTVKGSNARGVRLFGFTHRTFMEYLAAEALVRNAAGIEQITDEIVRVFEADPSSVLPDVLVQCVDDKFDRGAESILKSLIERGERASGYGDKYLSLCLRIVNSSPMSRQISTPLPGEIQSYWRKIGRIDETLESSRAFFELYRDPRNRVLRALSDPDDDVPKRLKFDQASFIYSVCSRWARFSAMGEIRYFEPEWQPGLDPHLTSIANAINSNDRSVNSVDSTLVDYLIGAGMIRQSLFAPQGGNYEPQIYVKAFGWLCPGSAMRALLKATSTPDDIEEHEAYILKWCAKYLPRRRISHREALDIWDMLAAAQGTLTKETHQAHVLAEECGQNQHVLDLLLWLAFLLYEVKAPSMHSFHSDFDGVIGLETMINLAATRERRLGVKDHVRGNVITKVQVREILAKYPDWAISWVNGKHFVEDIKRQN